MSEQGVCYVDPKLERVFEEIVLEPAKCPSLYHKDYLPRISNVLIVGREGVGKYEMLKELCLRNQLEFITIEIPKFEPEKVYRKVRNTVVKENRLIIIRHAERLVTRTRDLQTRKLAVDLKPCGNDVLFAICDEPPSSNPSDPLQGMFFQQFKALVCVTAPPHPVRKSLFTRHFAWLNSHLISLVGKVNVTVVLNEQDMTWLADCSAMATPKEILSYCCSIFRELVHLNRKPVLLDKEWIQQRMASKGAIVSENSVAEENRFRMACGLGHQTQQENNDNRPWKRQRVEIKGDAN
jgi:hypothetical protein